MARLTTNSWVSIGTLCAAVGLTVAVVRSFEAQATEIATMRVRVDGMDRRIDDLKERADTNDARWGQVLSDLGAIKERLGIVESRPK